jgi:hypothetical protein
MARKQIELLRQATTAQRFARVRSMSQSAVQLARRAIRRTMPNASEQDVLLTFVAIHYGAELADRLRAYLPRR